VLPESTAGRGPAAKPYVLAGQRACLEASLARRNLAGQYRVQPNPIYPYDDGHWHLERLGQELPPIDVLRMPTAGDQSPCTALNQFIRASQAAYVACIPAGVISVSPDWLREGVSQLELNADAALVGGRTLDREGRLVAGAPILGLGGMIGMVDQGAAGNAIGYFGLSLSPHNVAAVHQVPWIARRDVLAEMPFDDAAFPAEYYLADLCLRLLCRGWRIVYSPHLVGLTAGSVAATSQRDNHVEAARLSRRHAALIANDPYYSPLLSLNPEHAYQPSSLAERMRTLTQHGVVISLHQDEAVA
jgi:hypothetical protein